MFCHFICISGFLQTEARAPGTWRLAEKLRAAGFSRGSRLRVTHKRWNADWDNQAAEIAHLAGHYDQAPRVAVFAYSWGAGYGAMELARQLHRRGLGVETMVLSDPVYRHPLAAFRWLALLRDSGSQWHFLAPPVIRLPKNVHQVWTLRQSISVPQAHRLVATNGTLIHQPLELERDHCAMDDAPEFHQLALACAADMTHGQAALAESFID